ncbi:MAG: MarR family winged helix-turn-helix transcriptional regulator [Anaerolineaceae bacterium]
MAGADQDNEKFDTLMDSLGEWVLEFFTNESQGLSLKENMVLQVAGARKFIRMSDLSSLLHLPLTTATSMVDRLVEKGILKRSRFEDERRIVAVSLTPDGQALWEKQKMEQARWLQDRLALLSEGEQQQLFALLEKIAYRDGSK